MCPTHKCLDNLVSPDCFVLPRSPVHTTSCYRRNINALQYAARISWCFTARVSPPNRRSYLCGKLPEERRVRSGKPTDTLAFLLRFTADASGSRFSRSSRRFNGYPRIYRSVSFVRAILRRNSWKAYLAPLTAFPHRTGDSVAALLIARLVNGVAPVVRQLFRRK